MIIRKIRLTNFRNYESLSVDFDPSVNILYGSNAQGKTNLLEACYVSGTTRSHRGSRDREMIRFGEQEAHIRTEIEKQGRNHTIDLHLSVGKKKKMAIDHVPLKKASEIFGFLNIIFFSPEDLNIIKNGPSERRRFLDAELCQISRVYLSDLSNYNKVLNQRNRLLKEIWDNPSLKSTLSVWDDQLVSYGKKVITARYDFVNELSEIVRNMHHRLTGGKENLRLSYEPNIDAPFFEDELLKQEEKDIRFGSTSVGPHRDDLALFTDDMDIRKFGSQGQQRTCALSLKLSEIAIVEKKIKDKPVLLLDDVLSELDSDRQEYLLSSISDTQTLITCTGLDAFVKSHFDRQQIFEIENASVKVQS